MTNFNFHQKFLNKKQLLTELLLLLYFKKTPLHMKIITMMEYEQMIKRKKYKWFTI